MPVAWNERLFLFFPQIIKKTLQNQTINDWNANTLAGKTLNESAPQDCWEIKIAWSEYRNGKWTQKQISKESLKIAFGVDEFTEDEVDQFGFPSFQFSVVPDSEDITILTNSRFIPDKEAQLNTFIFDGYTFYLGTADLGKNNKMFFSHQTLDDYFTESFDEANNNEHISFYHVFSNNLLSKINSQDLKDFFSYNLSDSIDRSDAFGSFDDDNITATPEIYHELKRPYSIYNWEMFFHIPMLLADSLSKSGHFEEAMKWFHYVFNPMAEGSEDNRFWQFTPFRETDSKHILETIFNSLKPNQPDSTINEWRSDPFKPHLVARSRPVAYMKWVVMKYIDNLVAWGDNLFRQDTIESINQATQLYVLAGHILGSRPQKIPARHKAESRTYNSLKDKWDAFSNAMVEMENIVPYSNQSNRINISDIKTVPDSTTFDTSQFNQQGGKTKNETAFSNVAGFASSLYFCTPDNPKLTGYWDTVADRLFKIRHCQNIEGIFRKISLFEPPIDPALLVNAAAQGLSISSVLNDLYTTTPNYRFYYLLQKALELCNELKSLGSVMLSAIEKQDNEKIALIHARHENSLNNLVMEIKKQQVEEATKSLESLEQNRKSSEHRMKYYLQLIGEDTGKVPDLDVDFNEIPNPIETPLTESGLKLSKYEMEETVKAGQAHEKQREVNISEALAAIYHALPELVAAASPLGVGGQVIFGGSHSGSAANARSKIIEIEAGNLSYESSNSGRKGSFQRALQERITQANAAGLEIKQIDKQITAQQIRIAIANQEIANQQKMIDNAEEIEEFLKNKYSNEELYHWMRDSLKSLFRQVYGLAFDLAKKAEKTYCFERGLSDSNFIQAGYWNESYSGLLSGEHLYVGLKQLEAAYQENRGYDYEITKHISLRQIDPLNLLKLKEEGNCEFRLPEVLFDMDYPGHYRRRIKSVSISIPCIAGPYTNVNATLRLSANEFRNSATISGNKYAKNTGAEDPCFNSFNIPITSIAASSAQNDSGMFELNFKDERYLPFEGAGVISRWKLELPPKEFSQFDYDTISDAVIHLRYTSSEGGDKLRTAAANSVRTFISKLEELSEQEGLFIIIDLKHDLPTEWHKMTQEKSNKLVITDIYKFLPFQALKKSVTANVITIYSDNMEKVEFNLFDPENPTASPTPFPSNGKQFDPKNTNLNLSFTGNLDSAKKALMIIQFKVKS